MKKIFIIVMFSLSALSSFSQWNWSNPSPFGYSLQDDYFTDENTGYIVGEKGTILKTTDAGISWNFMSSGTLRMLRQVCFTSSETGYITGDDGLILKTTDGGISWQELQSGTTETFNDIFFINDNFGFIAGNNGQLLRTTDGGETWQRAFIDIYSDVYSVYFVNENVGYAAASMRTVFKTVDGGDTWTSTSGDPYLNLRSIFFLDAFNGYVAGEDNFMMKTTNGGFSWTHFQSNRPIERMQFINELTGYAVSYNELVKTNNGGTTWTPVGMADIRSYCFAGSNTVYGVGSFGRLFKSEDAGAKYTNYTTSVTDANLEDVHFPDENTGYAVSQYDVSGGLRYGQVLKTTDAGETWQITADGDFGRLTSVYFTDVNTGYMVSGYGNIYKTTDGGFEWDTLANINGHFLSKVVFVNADIGFIAAEDQSGIILRTTDAGMTWSIVYENSNPVRGIYFVDENTGYAIHSNSVLKTVNGGTNWTETPLGNEGILLDVFFVNQNAGYVCGFFGDFYKTTDGGETWTDLSGQFMNSLINMFFIDENTGYMCGDNCTFFQTDNGGFNWTRLDYLPCIGYGSVLFTDDQTGFVVGSNGFIFKTTNGGLVSSETHSIPESGITLFPNPANSIITITPGENISGQPAVISIISCNGTLVMQRSFKELPAPLDVSALAPGIYLLHIQSPESVETMKLVKM